MILWPLKHHVYIWELLCDSFVDVEKEIWGGTGQALWESLDLLVSCHLSYMLSESEKNASRSFGSVETNYSRTFQENNIDG